MRRCHCESEYAIAHHAIDIAIARHASDTAIVHHAVVPKQRCACPKELVYLTHSGDLMLGDLDPAAIVVPIAKSHFVPTVQSSLSVCVSMAGRRLVWLDHLPISRTFPPLLVSRANAASHVGQCCDSNSRMYS
jgi:hypothetical protein